MSIGDLDLNLLRVFDAILRSRSVTAAGAQIGLTQPAMSNALARLRALLGDALFVRTPAGMIPTPYARSIAEPVHRSLTLIETTLARGAEFDPTRSDRTFRLYMSDIGEMVFLPSLLERLGRDAPALRVETVQMPEGVLREALGSGDLDLAIGFLPGLRAQVESRALFRDPYVCLFRADHPRIGGRLTRRLFREALHALVSSVGSGHRVVADALLAAGLDRQIALRVPHFMVVPMILERTDLVATVPERVAMIFERPGRLRSLPPPVPIPRTDVRVHWHERYSEEPGNRWLRELVVELHGAAADPAHRSDRRRGSAA